MQSAWFAQYNTEHYPWIYHEEHGWMLVAKADAYQIWLWDACVGWLWTTPDAYPALFNNLSGWVGYQGKEDDNRRFWDFSVEEVLTDEAVPGDLLYFPVPGPFEYYRWTYEIVDSQTVTVTDTDLSMSMTFDFVEISFDGSTLERSTVLDADISGYGIIEGTQYPLTGNATAVATEQMGWNALGIYQTSIDGRLMTEFILAGFTFEGMERATMSGFDEILVGFPWRGDMYEFPIGTVFTQQCLDGWIEGESYLGIVGFPEFTERETISHPLTVPLNLRFEIIAKYPTYSVAGRMYENVVEVSYSQNVADPNDGTIADEAGRQWYAPGIGLIRSSSDDPMFAETLNFELVHTNLW